MFRRISNSNNLGKTILNEYRRIRLKIVDKNHTISLSLKGTGVLLIGCCATVVTFTSGFSAFSSSVREMDKRIHDVNEALSFSLAKSKALFPEDTGSSPIYIPRTELENKIKNMYLNNNLISCAHNFIYSPKGAGKSSLVA